MKKAFLVVAFFVALILAGRIYLRQRLSAFVIRAGGSANAQTVTLSPAPTPYAASTRISFVPVAANTTTSPTIKINSWQPLSFTKCDGYDLAVGDLDPHKVANIVITPGSGAVLLDPQAVGCQK